MTGMATSAALAALARVSADIGSDIALVQGAGGNSSVKAGGVLWVKASGTWLADAQRAPIFVPVDLAAARQSLAAGEEAIAALPGDGAPALRPSIETCLHALLPQPAVLHVHGVNSIAWSARRDAPARLPALLDGLRWAWIPYCRPGLPLAAAVAQAAAEGAPDVLLLGNHGLVTAAPDLDRAAALARAVERRLALPARPAAAAQPQMLEALAAGSPYRAAGFALGHAVATDPASLRIAAGGSLYPDHVVFLGPGARTLSEGETPAQVAQAASAAGLAPPPFLLAPGAGALVLRDLSPGAEAALACLGMVAARLPLEAPLRYLTPDEERALLGWDAEHYRKALSRPS